MERTYILREKLSGKILTEPNYHGNGEVINIITSEKEIEDKQKMYYRNYYIDELKLIE